MGQTALKMNQIILVVAFLGSAALCEEVVRKPKLFFVSTSATTSTLQTASVCYISGAAAPVVCGGRKRRTISLDAMEPEGAVQPSTFKREVEGESVQDEGGKVPPLLDHHHLHLHLHLLHNHVHCFECNLHTAWNKPLLDLNSSTLSIFCYELFV